MQRAKSKSSNHVGASSCSERAWGLKTKAKAKSASLQPASRELPWSFLPAPFLGPPLGRPQIRGGGSSTDNPDLARAGCGEPPRTLRRRRRRQAFARPVAGTPHCPALDFSGWILVSLSHLPQSSSSTVLYLAAPWYDRESPPR